MAKFANQSLKKHPLSYITIHLNYDCSSERLMYISTIVLMDIGGWFPLRGRSLELDMPIQTSIMTSVDIGQWIA